VRFRLLLEQAAKTYNCNRFLASEFTPAAFETCEDSYVEIEVALGDITKQDVDVVVNVANSSGGVEGAIHRAAGPRFKFRFRPYLVSCAAIMVLSACSPAATPVTDNGYHIDPRPESLTDQAPNEFTPFFQEWFASVGASDIETRGAAVSRKGNRASFAARGFSRTSTSEEVEFLTTLPDGRIIQDFVAGNVTETSPEHEEVLQNFSDTTMHVINAAFFDDRDNMQLVRDVTINGKPRKIYVGDILSRGDALQSDDVLLLRESIVDAITTTLPLDDLAHWYKVVYGESDGAPITLETSMDSAAESDFSRQMAKVSWPKSGNGFYSFKLFVLVK
jgi:Family of unknown function (DUF6348)